jgi:hypothetical protein
MSYVTNFYFFNFISQNAMAPPTLTLHAVVKCLMLDKHTYFNIICRMWHTELLTEVIRNEAAMYTKVHCV